MNFIWTVETLFVRKTEDQLSNVVIIANWNCSGSDGAYKASSCGCTEFAPPTGSFTPYEDLTQDQVLQWCYENGVDKNAIEANVTLQIENQINPPVVTLPLPWAAQPLPPVPPPVVVAEPVVVADDPAA